MRFKPAGALAILIACALTTAAKAETKGDQFVFVGLRPTAKENGPNDIKQLADAQAIRTVAQGALQDLSKQAVVGHDDLARVLGARYLVAWFDCKGQLGCIIRVIAPLRNSGFKTAVTGDFFVAEDGVYHVKLVAFTIADGKVSKQLSFELAADDVKSPAKWTEALAPLLGARAGRVKVIANVADAVCTIDGAPCKFEADGQTLSALAGEHTILLTKDGYLPEKLVVTIETGGTQEVAVALKQADAGGQVVGKVTGPRKAPSLIAIRTDARPAIDGKLDDVAWQKAWLESNFTQNFPDEGKDPSERTELRVLYDDDAIYVAIHCYDKHPEQIVARLTRRDRDIDGDKVAVEISSKNDKASAYHFQVSAAGVQVDGTRFNDTDMNTDWDGRWYSSVTRDDKGWTAELEIPLVTLRYDGDVSSFGFQVRRYQSRRGEIDEWSYVPRTAKGEVSYYGSIDNITGLNAKRLFQVLVYDSRRIINRTGQGAFDGSDTGGNIGGDLKIGITPALTLDGTVNPDFGTVEVDQVVLNLSTVETYFPEKRPFFLEGADLFATHFNLFYSRRVGATPPSATLGPYSSLLKPAPDGRIWGALKLTGLIGDRLSIGMVDALTSREDVDIERMPGAQPSQLMVEPLTNFGVLRLRKDFGTNSSIGMLGTAVNRIEPAGAAAPLPMDLCPVPYSTTFTSLVAPPPEKGRCTNDAYTGGVDMTLRTDDGAYGASVQAIGSLIQGGPTRLIPDGTVIASGAKGAGLAAELGRYGGEHWLYHFGYGFSTPRLQINDAGYQDVANYHDFFGSVTWRETTPSDNLQSASVELFFEHKREWKFRDNIDFDPEIKPTLQFPNLWTVSGGFSPYFLRYVENRETQDGARTQRPAGTYGYLDFKTDTNKDVVFGASGSYLVLIGGARSFHGSLTLSLKPIPTFEVDIIPSVGWVYASPRWVTTEMNADNSLTYYFADLDAKNFDVTLRGTYTFTRTLSLQAYLQPFVASGHYSQAYQSTASGPEPLLTLESFTKSMLPGGINPDFRYGTFNVNLFARWEYLPLSALWLVYTHSQDQTGYDPSEGEPRLRFKPFIDGPTTDVVLVKLSYLWY